ncbi:MAG TPA: hypothetical protein PKA00_18480 [Saprospiraceae bacterium]|nr:hypothetical protein [Saprospiraceae bacterium]HMQ84906.1 hypothetical protein [Saprospiraceae bacterium]
MKIGIKYGFVAAFLYCFTGLYSQTYYLPLNHQLWDQIYQQRKVERDSLFHFTVRPVNPFRFSDYYEWRRKSEPSELYPKDSVAFTDGWQRLKQEMRFENRFATQTWFGRKLLQEDLFRIQKTDFGLAINPLGHLQLGRDSRSGNELTFRNTRGLQLMGRLGRQLTFYTDFHENQAFFPLYVREWVQSRPQRKLVIPGQGIPKRFKGDRETYDFAYVSGHFNWQLSRHVNFQMGYGKNFVGHGYRSLLLSDNSFYYPYFRIQTDFWKVQYTNIYAQLRDVRIETPDGTYGRKYLIAHQLSINLTPKLNVGLYEGIIYADTLGIRGLEWEYLNPIIFFRPLEFAIGSQGGNVVLGANARYAFTPRLSVYGQLLIDEFVLSELRSGDGWWGNKYAYQLGAQYALPKYGLLFRTEYNTARPYTYTHNTLAQNYAHYNQSLAHPLGANFRETLLFVQFYKKRFFVETQFMYATQGLDNEGSNWGGDIYLDYENRESDYGNFTTQGVLSTTLLADLKTGWVLNPAYNLRFELGLTYRRVESDSVLSPVPNQSTKWLHFGLVTRLDNQYLDF